MSSRVRAAALTMARLEYELAVTGFRFTHFLGSLPRSRPQTRHFFGFSRVGLGAVHMLHSHGGTSFLFPVVSLRKIELGSHSPSQVSWIGFREHSLLYIAPREYKECPSPRQPRSR